MRVLTAVVTASGRSESPQRLPRGCARRVLRGALAVGISAGARVGLAAVCLSVPAAGSAAAWASTAAAAPALGWTVPAAADRSGRPTAVSCPGESLCVLADGAGWILTSADPTAAAPTWGSAPVDAGREPTAVSCASALLCAAVDAHGYALTSADPAGGTGAWTSRSVDGAALTGVSCPTGSLCVAVDAAGAVLVSTEPAADTWRSLGDVDGGARLVGVSCSSASLCVAVDAAGGAIVSGQPAVAGSWKQRRLDGAGAPTAVSCGANGVCVAVDASGDALAGSDPLAAAPTWSTTEADGSGHGLTGVGCAPDGTCVAVDGGGGALASETPAGPSPDWSFGAPDGEALVGVSCSAGSFCLAVDAAGRTLSASLPEPPAPVAPPPLPRPSILGTPAQGARLECQPGSAVAAAPRVQLSYAWLRESEPIGGAGAPIYVVTRGDEGRHLQCRVTASDAAGSASATSAFVTVPFQGLPVAAGETAVGRARARGAGIAVPIACSGRAPHGCALLLRLLAAGAGRHATLGARRLHVARGERATVAVGLSAAGRRLLERRRRVAALLVVSGTVIGSIEAALSSQRLIFTAGGPGRLTVRLVSDSACLACAEERGSLAPAFDAARADGGPVVRAASEAILAATPYMGWDSYLAFGPEYSESTVLEQASDLLAFGLARRGYRYVWLDVGWWQGLRDREGRIELDRGQWPHGIAWLASTLHHAGLLLGLYTDAGSSGCGGVGQGGYGHYRQDAETFAAWGVDAVKVDFCGGARLGLDPALAYREFRAALDASGRSMLLSICDFLQPGERGEGDPPSARSAFGSYLFGPQVGNSWRTDGDVGFPGHVPFVNVLRNLDADAAHPEAAGPGHWNDPDYLGPDQGMGAQQFRTQVSMWAMLAAPLMVSRDLGRLSRQSLAALRDVAVVAIDQDPLGAQATLLASDGGQQVWVKPLADGSRAVALLNRASTAARIATSAGAIGLAAARRYTVQNLWRGTASASTGPIGASVAGYGTVLLRVSAG
jgi:hypothetical protein